MRKDSKVWLVALVGAVGAAASLGVGERTAAAQHGRTTTTCAIGDAPSGASTGRWKTIARMHGKVADLPEVREDLAGCVAGGLVRGITHANGGLPTGYTAESLYKELIERMKEDPKIQWVLGTRNADGSISGGGGGEVQEFKDLKVGLVLELISKGKLNNIKTDALTSGGTGAKQRPFLLALADKLKSGKTVEIDIAFGTKAAGHFALLVEVVERGNDIGFIIADDRDQGDPNATTQERGPYFLTAAGTCYYLDKISGATRPCKHANWVRGALVQSR